MILVKKVDIMKFEVEEDGLPKKEFYDPGKRVDIVSPARRHVIENFGNRDPEDMLRYYASRIGRINEKCTDIKEELDKLMKDVDTTLFGNKPFSKETWMEYWELLESAGERFDEHGVLLPKYNYNPDLMQGVGDGDGMQVYDFHMLFGGILDMLFSPGNDNIVYGKKGDGKSNFCLWLGIEAIKTGKYKLVTNLGIIKEYNNPDIYNVSWMSGLLRIVCDNRNENMRLEREGRKDECKHIVCILDECENFILSLRSLSKEVVEFNKFNQMTRKLDLSMTMIFHRLDDVPKSFRDSPNLNARILKGIDEDNNPLPNPKKVAILDVKSRGIKYEIDYIPKNPVLDTRRMSGFSIYHPKFLEKSIDMDQIFRIVQDEEPDETPNAILKYLSQIRIESRSYEIMLKVADQIELKIRHDIDICKNSKEYIILATKKYEEVFKVKDVSETKDAEKAIKKIVGERYDLYQIEERKRRIDPSKIAYKFCNIDELKVFLNENITKAIKDIVNEDHRDFDDEEARILLDSGISKNRLFRLYGFTPVRAIID